MCLRFVFLLIKQTASWLRLSQREETWKIAEILLLRHQFAVLQRRQPRRPDLDWADRALHATLLAMIPKLRSYGLRLLVTPDTIVRWHRDVVAAAGPSDSSAARPAGLANRRNIKVNTSIQVAECLEQAGRYVQDRVLEARIVPPTSERSI